MAWKEIAKELFPKGFDIKEENNVLSGTALVEDQTVAIIGTANHAYVTVEIALAQAKAVLKTLKEHPKRPIVILIDTEGQNLALRDELLGLNSAMAHVGKCLDFARRHGHPIIGILYGHALSGGFITTGLLADVCYALKDTSIYVMGRAPMARIARIPEEQLSALQKENPIFSTNPIHYVQMGALEAVWEKNLAQELASALKQIDSTDRRNKKGDERGGRKMSYSIVQTILNET